MKPTTYHFTSYLGQPTYQERVVSADSEIRVHGTQYLLENLNVDDSLLIVDDVFSTGKNIDAIIKRLDSRLKRNMPQDIRVATLWQRPSYNVVNFKPDFCLHSTEDWLVSPYEMSGLTYEEIKQHKSFLLPFLEASSLSKN